MKTSVLFGLPFILGAALIAGCDMPGDGAVPATTDATPGATATPAPAPLTLEEAQQKVAVPPPSEKSKVPDAAKVVLETSRGPITVQLDGKAAPKHVRSFLYLVGLKFYDGTIFHRQADLNRDGTGNIIQGGDPFTRLPGAEELYGQGGPGYNVPLEISKLKHDKLMLAMARGEDPNSAGSQFYITQGVTHFLDEKYTVFGKVVAGQDAALALQQGDTLKTARVADETAQTKSK